MDERTIKARAAAVLSSTLHYDRQGRPAVVLTPSGSERAMHVRLTWHQDGVETSCACRGAQKGLCFHQLGAVLYSLRPAVVSVTKGRGNAQRLARQGGRIFYVGREDYGPELWLVVRPSVRDDGLETVDLPGELCPEEVVNSMV